MILIECYYAEHRCRLFRAQEDASGNLHAVRCEPTESTNAARRFRPFGNREEERAIAALESWLLTAADAERISGLCWPVAGDWVRDHM